jgi:hypothetical protein
MHARKANDELWKLTFAPANLETLIKAAVLLDGLDTDNEDTDAGERRNGTAREKLHSARNKFEILCGIGEDGDLPEERVRDFIRRDLSVIRDQIHEEGGSSRFKRWVVDSTTTQTISARNRTLKQRPVKRGAVHVRTHSDMRQNLTRCGRGLYSKGMSTSA